MNTSTHFTSSSGFELPIPETRPALTVWPAYVCIWASVWAASITLVPSAGHLWSQSTSPALAVADRILARWGLSIDQHAVPPTPPRRPMIAVVFGCILPDDDVLNSDHSENAISEREVGDLQDNTRQARWRQRSGRDAPHSEADEIRD